MTATLDRLLARIALHERFGDAAFDFHRWLFDLLMDVPVGTEGPTVRVLEVGAGTGRVWRVNAGRLPPSWQITLTDREEGMLEQLRELAEGPLAEHGVATTVQHADATALPFPDASFDKALANHMLYHLADPADGIRELRRVLKVGGLLVAATNGSGHMREASAFARRLVGIEGLSLTGVEALSFTCESGRGLLGAEFGSVELHERRDELEVTDAEALLAYVRSLIHLSDDVPEATERALNDLEAEVRGVQLPFRIGRATGVFLAR